MSAYRIIVHVDMDYFFAAVEEREHSEYRGKPVIVGADPKEGKGRGVVSTCNYEARKFGIKSGMPISKAWKRSPQGIYVPVNYKLYTEVSSKIMDILKRHADKFEQFSIDEAFLDVSSRAKNFEDAKRLAEEIKKEIYEKEKLTCSIGVGPNKLVAKIASDFRKPDGLTIVEEHNVKQFLSPLPVNKLWGVGKKTAQKLNKMNIKTIGDLAAYDPSRLREEFGVMGVQFHLMANGIDESEIQEEWEIKSVGRDTTFEEDTSDPNMVLQTLTKLSQEICKQIMDSGLLFKTVAIRVRYENFETHTHGKTLSYFTNRLKDIEKTSHQLIQPYLKSNRKIRLVGVRVSKLLSGEKQKILAT